MKRFLPFAIIVVVLAVALGAAWYLKRSAQESTAANASSDARVPPVPAGPPAPGAEPPHVRGSENAPVTLEEFGDFECPPCGVLYPMLKTIEGEFGPRLRVIFHEFPLVPPHVHALAAARAAEAAGMQGKFWEMHDLLYENQKTWSEAFDVRPLFEGYASRIGLDVERFKQDQTGEIVALRITLDGSRGHSLGVKSTPTVFINGRELPFESFTLDGLRAAINNAASGTSP
jgi:protein-disulfide isomerase